MKKIIIFSLISTLLVPFLFGLENLNARINENSLGGMHYIWWNFGREGFKELNIKFTIHDDLLTKDGIYLQMYQGEINGVGFYFGLQTRVGKSEEGLTGKGLVFSRWGTRDLSNAKPAQNGWTESAGYEGDFISIRKAYEWTNHKYSFRICFVESDNKGDWYGVWIEELENHSLDYLGSLRFPKVSANRGIKDGGATWTEIYYREKNDSALPNWHVSIDEIFGINFDDEKYYPKSATLICSEKFQNINIIYDESLQKIHFYMGENIEKNFDSKKIDFQNLVVDYLPKPITAGIFPEITGEPLTIKITDRDGNPIDLSLDGKYSDDYIFENCFEEEDIEFGIGKWLRKSINDSDIVIDFSDKKEGIYRFYGFIANDKGEFKIKVKTSEDDLKGEVIVTVDRPKVKFEIMNLDDKERNVFIVDGSEDSFKMTAGDLRSYRVSVEVRDALGKIIGSTDFEKGNYLKCHKFYLQYSSFFIPSVSFSPKYNNLIVIEDFLGMELLREFSIYQNTSFDSGLVYENGIPLRGGIYNFDYNYDRWDWGEVFPDINKNKKIDIYDTLELNGEGKTSFVVIPTDVGFLSGLIGSVVNLYTKKDGHPFKTFSSDLDISGGEYENPDSIMQIDYFSHIDKKIEIGFIDFEFYKIVEEDNIKKEISLTKDAFNPDNYDFTYGIENNLLIKAYPADKRDLSVREDIKAYLVGRIEIWQYGSFSHNEYKETVVNFKLRFNYAEEIMDFNQYGIMNEIGVFIDDFVLQTIHPETEAEYELNLDSGILYAFNQYTLPLLVKNSM